MAAGEPCSAEEEASDSTSAAARRGGGRRARREGGAAWRAALAELSGTALLVLLSCLAGAGPSAATLPLHRALAAGFVVAALVQSLEHVSGAFFNPTVLLAGALWRRVAPRRALLLAAAQLLGAALGAGALRLLRPAACAACVTRPAPGLRPAEAALLEALLGGVLALANCGAWDERNAAQRDSWPLRIGVTVAALSLVAVYWVAPPGGSLLATLLYRAVWLPPTRAHAAGGA